MKWLIHALSVSSAGACFLSSAITAFANNGIPASDGAAIPFWGAIQVVGLFGLWTISGVIALFDTVRKA